MNMFDYAPDLSNTLDEFEMTRQPWEIVDGLEAVVRRKINGLDAGYVVTDEVAIHATARVDASAAIKPPAIVGPGCFIGPHALLRGGVYLAENVSIGPACEVKRSLVCRGTSFAHFNFVGDSIIGAGVNLEAGAITANHYNEREDKTIFCMIDGSAVNTGTQKFGALIGDDSKLGANSVTSPGTILGKRTVVKRLELIEQVKPS